MSGKTISLPVSPCNVSETHLGIVSVPCFGAIFFFFLLSLLLGFNGPCIDIQGDYVSGFFPRSFLFRSISADSVFRTTDWIVPQVLSLPAILRQVESHNQWVALKCVLVCQHFPGERFFNFSCAVYAPKLATASYDPLM